MPGLVTSVYSLQADGVSARPIVGRLTNEIEIPPGSDYYVHFISENSTLTGKEVKPYSNDLSEKVRDAIAKAPLWIQRRLTRQFQNLAYPGEYADLLLNTSTRFADEIAFSIACSSIGKVPPVEVIRDNVVTLYENDKWVHYADIVDYDNGSGEYYSTVRYRIMENETEQQFECPRDIYYWYVAHPELAGEDAEYVYGTLWREYLFNHNDIGYPLMKEKLASIQYLWDGDAYYQPGDRLWRWSLEHHPTAIEVISYWIGKTIPAGALGDRPGQPNVIAHEHNGWCGELQRIAVAAQRAALVPSVCANNIGEDHVWREFYDRGWHENDNWWTDSGGAVDQPDVYAYGWGKAMSALFAWKGDDMIYDITSRYIHPEDRITVKFNVKDGYLNPVDGARITVVVDGLKDIVWIKNILRGKFQELWDKLPQLMKGTLLQTLYTRVQERIQNVPDVIDGPTITTWNFTNIHGECTFELGKNREYLFIIQQGNLRKPWQLARHNAVRLLSTHDDATFKVFLPDYSHRIQRHCTQDLPTGDCQFDLSFSTAAYQFQKNVKTDDLGTFIVPGSIEWFLLDTDNFNQYQSGKQFTCAQYHKMSHTNKQFNTENTDWYIVFRNTAQNTDVLVDFSIQVSLLSSRDHVQIVSPDTSLFDHPVALVGDTVSIAGIATDAVNLTINNETVTITPTGSGWQYNWDTSESPPGEYLVSAICGKASDEQVIPLIDPLPPTVTINDPYAGMIVTTDLLLITGQSWDNYGIDRVDVSVDTRDFSTVNGTSTWSIEWNISGFDLGEHIITARATDHEGRQAIHNLSFIVNESGHTWHPHIHNVYRTPAVNVTNISNVVVYANVSSPGPFEIKHVNLTCDNGTAVTSHNMYQYATFPVQARHEEDPLFNESNTPRYGIELGELPAGESITYWIQAYDTANNSIISDPQSLVISE